MFVHNNRHRPTSAAWPLAAIMIEAEEENFKRYTQVLIFGAYARTHQPQGAVAGARP